MTKRRLLQTCRGFGAGLLLILSASLSAAGEKVQARREGHKLRLGNDLVSVVFDESNGTWNVEWPGKLDAAVSGVRFSLLANKQALTPNGVKAETAAFTDAIGSGREILCRWGKGIEVEQHIRLYDSRPAIVVSARVTNHTDRDVTLDAVKMFDSSAGEGGSWRLAGATLPPAAVCYPYAKPACRPAPKTKSAAGAERAYASQGVLAFSPSGSSIGLVLGCLSSREGWPEVNAAFQTGKGGTALDAGYDLSGKGLPAGKSVELDPVWLAVEADHFAALDHYGDAVAALCPLPVHTGADALWCSWYPLRMKIDEENVLANARIAAQFFKPLGMEVIQLDHGWQRGDVCGDWFHNERFPHGLKWLSEQLQSRYGMKMGLWIAPTQVAETTQLYHDHPEWLKQDASGKPRVYNRWFWKPNPGMCRLDVAHPAAEKWMEETFARLTAEGAAYYKIDFIAGSPSLGKAMAAIRRGAGPKAWIRYCQTPPLLNVGLANSSYIGDDTGDAGLPDWMRLMRNNAPLLAASYWANDRLYHREICDMSVGMKAGVEEVRFRMTIMTMAGCSISFSDDFRDLKPARIRMMQKCLPPGNPAARPLDLFDRQRPSMWRMHCKNTAGEWDAVGLLNFEDQPEERTVELSALGLPADAEVIAFEFWEGKYLGPHKGSVSLTLAPRTARILLIHRRPTRPQVIATDMHLLGGYHEIKRVAWDEKQLVLSGEYRRAPDMEGKAYIYVPDGYRLPADSPRAKGNLQLTQPEKNIVVQQVRFEDAQVDWAIPFEFSPPAEPSGK